MVSLFQESKIAKEDFLMKKGFVILLILACLFSLVACDPGWAHIDGEALLRNTSKIELVYYENTDPKLIDLRKSNIPNFDFNKVTPIAVLDECYFEDIITDISQQELLLFGRTLNEPIGKTLLLYQKDSSIVVLYGCVYKNKRGSKRYYGQCNIYDEAGRFIEYLGDIDTDYINTLESTYFNSSK